MDNELMKKRLEICKQCPLYKEHKTYGAICDNSKYVSKDGEKWSHFRKDGYVRGCGCTLSNKTRNPSSHCIINKW